MIYKSRLLAHHAPIFRLLGNKEPFLLVICLFGEKGEAFSAYCSISFRASLYLLIKSLQPATGRASPSQCSHTGTFLMSLWSLLDYFLDIQQEAISPIAPFSAFWRTARSSSWPRVARHCINQIAQQWQTVFAFQGEIYQGEKIKCEISEQTRWSDNDIILHNTGYGYHFQLS